MKRACRMRGLFLIAAFWAAMGIELSTGAFMDNIRLFFISLWFIRMVDIRLSDKHAL
jgi:hypothetical protein